MGKYFLFGLLVLAVFFATCEEFARQREARAFCVPVSLVGTFCYYSDSLR